METNYNEEEELKKMAPQLFKIEKKEVFEAPENYFEKLPGLLQDKIHSKVKAKNYWVPDYKLALAAASVCLFIFAGIKFYSHSGGELPQMGATELAQDYDSQYLASADEIDLAEQLDDESLETTQTQIDENSGVSNEEITDYLLSNNIDLTTITNEF